MVEPLDQVQRELGFSDDSEVILSVNGVSKRFCRDLKRSLLYGLQDIAIDLLDLRQPSNTLRPQEFWALQDVSFQLRRGEALGLIGKNGGGKSTLLRIIAGLIKPDAGSVEIKGRVAPLIALGAGFSPILTGRENIYANMSILGLSKQEIDQRFDEVVEFAEIGDAIDSPVQTYSSGMAARLGFASAIHTEPDILLIDEVLAVGDSRFRGKCFQKLHDLRRKGTAFVLVSHNSHSILTVCESAVYLRKGQCIGFGDAQSVMIQYEEELFLTDSGEPQSTNSIATLKKRETVGVDIKAIFFRNGKGSIIDTLNTGEPSCLCVEYEVLEAISDVSITFSIKGMAEGGETILTFNNLSDKKQMSFLPGTYEVQVQMPYLGLRIGTYLMNVFVKKDRLYHLDAVESFKFVVRGAEESVSRCLFYQPRVWNLIDHQNVTAQTNNIKLPR